MTRFEFSATAEEIVEYPEVGRVVRITRRAVHYIPDAGDGPRDRPYWVEMDLETEWPPQPPSWHERLARWFRR